MIVFTRKFLFLCLAYSLLFGQLACAEEAITARDYSKFYGSVSAGDIEKVDYYLSKGLDPNWKEEPFKTMPLLHKAINCYRDTLEQNQQIIIKKLLGAGIDPQFN